MALLRGDPERCPAITVCMIDRSPVLNQVLGYLQMTLLGGDHERCNAILICLIERSPLLNQQADHGLISQLGRIHQGGAFPHCSLAIISCYDFL